MKQVIETIVNLIFQGTEDVSKKRDVDHRICSLHFDNKHHMSNQRGLDYYIEYNKRAYLRQNGTPSFFIYIIKHQGSALYEHF